MNIYFFVQHEQHLQVDYQYTSLCPASRKDTNFAFNGLSAQRALLQLLVIRASLTQAHVTTRDQHHRLFILLTNHTQPLFLLTANLVSDNQSLTMQ